MASLTSPIVARELLIDVRVNLDAPSLLTRLATQQAPPPSFVGRGIIDTGSNATGVSAAVARQLALTRFSQSSSQGIGGLVTVDLYRASLTVCDAAQPHVPWLTIPDIVVFELIPDVPHDVLIGMDVLLQCRLTVDGPAGVFPLDY
jgi:hypothetical protein